MSQTANEIGLGVAEAIDEMFTRHWPGGSVQRKAAVQVLIRDLVLIERGGISQDQDETNSWRDLYARVSGASQK